jgi:type II secretory pathway pseudopilin PulG
MLIIALVAAGGLTMLVKSLERNQFKLTEFRMQTIQKALLDYRKTFNRLPCPADATLALTDANFAVEAANPGRCTGGTPAATYSRTETLTPFNFTNTSPTVTGSTSQLLAGMYIAHTSISGDGTTIRSIDSATQFTMATTADATSAGVTITWQYISMGMVPTKALGLPDDFAVDGWGRRFSYVVFSPATASNNFTKAFSAMPISYAPTSGSSISVNSDLSVSKVDDVLYAVISHGKNGHGGFPRNGGSARFNAGSVNSFEQFNCGCDSTANLTSNVFSRIIQRLPSENPTNRLDSFDDLVVFGTRQDLRTSME